LARKSIKGQVSTCPFLLWSGEAREQPLRDFPCVGRFNTHYLVPSASAGLEMQLALWPLQDCGKEIQQRLVATTIDWRSIDGYLQSSSVLSKDSSDSRPRAYVEKQHRVRANLTRPCAGSRTNQRARIRRLSRRSRLAIAPAFK
jgi:hypothetical protein